MELNTLEKELGDNVERVLKAYSSAAESGLEEMNEDERALASAWTKAYDKAASAGFRDLGSADEAYFEVRLG